MQQTLQQLPLTLAYIGADLVAIGILVGGALHPAPRASRPGGRLYRR